MREVTQRQRFIAIVVAVLFLSAGCIRAQEAGPRAPDAATTKAPGASLPRIEENRNLAPAGELRDRVLTVRLEIREGEWYPEAETGPAVVVQAFGEEGRALQIPGPFIRVPQGTEVRGTVRNALPKGTAKVYGLHGRPGDAREPLTLAPGEMREAHFTLAAAGTYFYWATTTDTPVARRAGVDSQLTGALVVDPPGAVAVDRVFVLGLWLERAAVPGFSQPNARQFAVINGKAWPYTERMTADAGQSVRWRWINASVFDHPMHLHGAYFRVTSRGDGAIDTAVPDERQGLVVTDRIAQGDTRAYTLLLEREGRWLFHCHLLAHMSAEYRHLAPTVPGSFQPAIGTHHAAPDSTGMWGMVLGLTVRPAAPPTSSRASAAMSTAPARKITLLVRQRPASDRAPAATVFQVQEGAQPPSLDAAAVPGPPLVLIQGEPVEITVVNQLREPTAIHWHGIELDSYYDGVPIWGGAGTMEAPAIEPGQSFVARFSPPRAGTFIYHTHWHNFLQLTSGLYGPLIVLRPGEKLDPETDRTVMIGLGGADDMLAPLLLNGRAQAEPLRLKAGVKYRLRLINITPNNSGLVVSLVSGSAPARWRALAKDGADLPAAQAIEREARQLISVGETYDFEFAPTTKGDLRLEVLRPFNRTWAVAEVQVR